MGFDRGKLRWFAAAICVPLSVTVLCGSAWAAVVLAPRVVGTADVYSPPVLGDSANLLVWQFSQDRFWLFDGHWHRREVLMPNACVDGHVAAAGAGEALVECMQATQHFYPDAPLRYALVDGGSATATFFTTPAAYPTEAGRPIYTAIGRYARRSRVSPGRRDCVLQLAHPHLR